MDMVVLFLICDEEADCILQVAALPDSAIVVSDLALQKITVSPVPGQLQPDLPHPLAQRVSGTVQKH